MDGVLRCSRYSFGPNRLHYCGPDKNREIKSYIDEGEADSGLKQLLSQFATLYPYLRFIAETNGIRDPFDSRVVEAYWLGNDLLQKVNTRRFHEHLLRDHGVKKKIGSKAFGHLENKLAHGAVPHHSFHVLNIWKRTGYAELDHTLQSFAECCVTWGKVSETNGPTVTVETEPIIYTNGRLALGAAIKRQITRRLEAEYDMEQIKSGNIVSIHWGVPCEILTARQAVNLKKCT